ncbi:MAG: site-specific integrase [Edaphobacter sp.]
MSKHYQNGYLRCAKRKSGLHCWEFLWRENNDDGKRIRRTAIVGTVEQFPTEQLAQAAANGLKVFINSDRIQIQPISISDLIDHYVQTELSGDASWHSHATRTIYGYFLQKWVRPHWGESSLRTVRTIAVEHWLRRICRDDGSPMADSTKAKLRNIMSVLFNHAICCEWLEQGRNPITLVRQSAKRRKDPVVLEPKEIQGILAQLEPGARLMVMLAVTAGLRRSEVFGLQWRDVNFSEMRISIQRSIYLGTIGNCKTETSRKPVPIDERVAADLWLLKEKSKYSKPGDWIFASSRRGGRTPLWPGTALEKVIRPAALNAGIRKKIGWHTFRHTYSTLLIANGENVKVVQELMRHASCRFTLEIYSQARLVAKREAQRLLVQAILPEWTEDLAPVIQGSSV